MQKMRDSVKLGEIFIVLDLRLLLQITEILKITKSFINFEFRITKFVEK